MTQTTQSTPSLLSAAPSSSAQGPSDTLVQAILHGIREKKGFDITVLDLREIPNVFANYMVVCSGTSDTQTKAVADSVLRSAREQAQDKPKHKEGLEQGEWILLDYWDVVVHVMLPRIRNFYDLEGMWADAHREDFEE